eukprot:snap_masked-scaffold_4-processed-gene-21.66-mRNA-1 protein AED:1.00 eAED:1.00 QI:0/-1/0/0/-1/1/1/0/68
MLVQWRTDEYEVTFHKVKEKILAAEKKNLNNYSSENNIVLVTEDSIDYWSTISGLEEVFQDRNDLAML